MTIIKDKIYSSCLERKQHEEKRNYLGFSIIGHICNRYLWLQFHHGEIARQMTEKQAVIFENGHIVEKKLIHQLRQAGFEITDQQVEYSLFDGLVKGHPDGIINHPEHGKVILEIKGVNNATFVKFVRHGVKHTSQTYYGQSILLAGAANLPGCVFLIENKDNQELYEEFIPFNQEEYEQLCLKAYSIIYFNAIPKGISSRMDWWQCFNCHFNHDEACRKQWEMEAPF